MGILEGVAEAHDPLWMSLLCIAMLTAAAVGASALGTWILLGALGLR